MLTLDDLASRSATPSSTQPKSTPLFLPSILPPELDDIPLVNLPLVPHSAFVPVPGALSLLNSAIGDFGQDGATSVHNVHPLQPVPIINGQPVGLLNAGEIWPQLADGRGHEPHLRAYVDLTRILIDRVADRFQARLCVIHPWPTQDIATQWVLDDWHEFSSPHVTLVRLTAPIVAYVSLLASISPFLANLTLLRRSSRSRHPCAAVAALPYWQQSRTSMVW
jgi:hypothetical protein